MKLRDTVLRMDMWPLRRLAIVIAVACSFDCLAIRVLHKLTPLIAAILAGLPFLWLRLRGDGKRNSTPSQPMIYGTRVKILTAYCFVILGAAMVAMYRAPQPGLWFLGLSASIPIVAAVIAGWPERSEDGQD